jgi:hypothetical protein
LPQDSGKILVNPTCYPDIRDLPFVYAVALLPDRTQRIDTMSKATKLAQKIRAKNAAKAENQPENGQISASPPLTPENQPEGPTVQDQNDVREQDQKTSPPKKKLTTVVIAHRQQKPFELTQRITAVQAPNPKHRGAAVRYSHYVLGMTCGEYIDVLKEKMNRTAKQTMDDIRWDFVSGFIKVE